MYPGCVFIKSASCDHALISAASSAGLMVNTLISTIGPPLICICSASVTFESSSLNFGMSTSPLIVTCLCAGGGVCFQDSQTHITIPNQAAWNRQIHLIQAGIIWLRSDIQWLDEFTAD